MNLLNDIIHRPFPISSKKWIMRQTWRNVFFLHWPIRPEALRPHIPAPLQMDTFDHYAWLGIVAFVMGGIYPRNFPFISITPRFSEVNVRTYVQYDGKPGVYFLSLDVQNWASYTIAKRWYRLPYYPAQISFQNEDKTIHCQSIRKGKINTQIAFNGSFIPSPEVNFANTGTIDHWLTERYCLYSADKRGNIYCGEIHHSPWPLQKIETEIGMNTLFSPFHSGLSKEKPISHFSKGIDSLIWNIKRIHI
ncbi:YqjF family protein [Bacillus sp. CGMCC 1.60114]|uniref:YqjF family protein n=1 Tax=unclassified Bacillus (in: firmicutes) TaxID=185979 RepID=UPI00363DA8B9